MAYLAGMALYEIERLVSFAVDAMAIRFAALAGTLRKGTAQEPFAGSQLRDVGTETAFGSGEFGAAERGGHVLY